REDLYYRLNVIPIYVPPLREHREDIPELVTYFVSEFCKESGRKPKRFSSDAIESLMKHNWPGNVRQLKNVIERMLIMIDHDEVVEVDVNWALEQNKPEKLKIVQDTGLKDMVSQSEKELIISTLKANSWNVSLAAQQLNLERSHLYKKMNKYGIRRPQE
ncbi:MAG: two-component system, NtrC family, nitrogen regulation response regulator NtrX, partial [Candidatus Poribacteria bacterium]|nr:two-component system, NtrC family, nitrogen regulation response regulator NtrX [Candidatus Poribacteria bacterium]